MKNLDVSAAVVVWEVILTREHVDSPKVFWNGSVRVLK